MIKSNKFNILNRNWLNLTKFYNICYYKIIKDEASGIKDTDYTSVLAKEKEVLNNLKNYKASQNRGRQK